MAIRSIELDANDGPGRAGILRSLFGARPARAAALPAGWRLYAIGDIHGRLDLLDTVLAAIRDDDAALPPCETVEVVLLGDLIDRGPHSAGVVARAMHPPGWARFHTLMGNHEHAMLAALDGDGTMARLWLDNGGLAALASWGVPADTLAAGSIDTMLAAAREIIPGELRAWLAARPLALRRGDYHFVHAGVRPGIPLDRQREHDALWIRDEFLSSDRDFGAVIVHGHTISDTVEAHANRIGVDTGAYRSGRLSALGLEGTRRWTLQTERSG